MQVRSIREVREMLGRLEKELAEGGEVTITKHGRAIARIVSVAHPKKMPTHRRLRESMRPMAQASEQLVRLDRDAR